MPETDAVSEMAALLESEKIVIAAVFVPRSKSPEPKKEQVNWDVGVSSNGNAVLMFPFAQRTNQLTAYERILTSGMRRSANDEEALKRCLESGASENKMYRVTKPTPTYLMGCLMLDYSVLGFASYEEWCMSFGLDAESRKAATIYKDCLAIALKLKAGLGTALCEKLATIAARM